MAFRDRVVQAMQAVFGTGAEMYQSRATMLPPAEGGRATPRDLYRLLRLYYHSNGLYDQLSRLAYEAGLWSEGMKPLRNPTYRVVEFYVAKVWGGALATALPIVASRQEIIPAIQQVWRWSNWAAQKQTAVRSTATCGDLFLKVVRTPTLGVPPDRRRVYLERVEPEYVTEFATDVRRFISYIRIDIPQVRTESEGGGSYTHTEIWDDASQTVRIWRHTQGENAPLAELPAPDEVHRFAEWGIDFIPIVWAPFRDIGGERGMAAIVPALDKIDEANRMATRLHQMLFRHNQVTWVLQANMMDQAGRPMQPPSMAVAGGDQGNTQATRVTVGDEVMYRLPGMASLQALVPPINYADALAVLRDHMREIERDLPELAYYSINEVGGDVSGRALRYMLTDAIDRVIEVRGNLDAALVRANQMALTLAQNAEIPGFSRQEIGTYEQGDFEHEIAERPVIPMSELEEAQTEQARASAAYTFMQAGLPFRETWRRQGYTDEQLDELERERATEASRLGGELLDVLNGVERPSPA